MKLCHLPLSGHAHRARLFLSLLGQEVETINVDLAAGAHQRPVFLRLNPFGQVPVLEDDGVVAPDSNAILICLPRKLGRRDWLRRIEALPRFVPFPQTKVGLHAAR